MASFESKVSDIFSENPRLARKLPVLIRQLFLESEPEFRRRLRNESEDVKQKTMLRLFDILFIDFFFDEINDWFLNWVIDRYPERFTELELDEMRAQAVSYLDFYEVQEVIPGKGSRVKSLYTQQEGFLKDISTSYHLVKWDVFLMRCYLFRGQYFATGSSTLFDPGHGRDILERIRKAHSEYIALFQDSDYAHFAKNRWDIFFQIEREIEEKAKNKKIYTTYGEFQPCEVRFQVQNLKSILEKLKFLDEFHFTEVKTRKDKKKKREVTRYQFDWLTDGIEKELAAIKADQPDEGLLLTTYQLDNMGNQIGIEAIGTFYLDKFLARLETQSVALAEFASSHFIHLFGKEALSFKRIVKKKIENKVKLADENELSEDVELDEPKSLIESKIMDQFYLSQLDQKIPALNNLTPREARYDPAVLPLLIEWLKGIENMLERKRHKGEQVLSIDKIKKALDIDY